MGKEDFYRQIEIVKQQIANEKLRAEKKAIEDQYTIAENNRIQEIERQKRESDRIETTRKNFRGTNIIETLKEIQEKEILTYDTDFKHFTKNFWTGQKKFGRSPMKIEYNIDSLTTSFDSWSIFRDDVYNDDSGCKSINIIKNDDNFELKYHEKNHPAFNSDSNDFKVSSKDPMDIIIGIAKVVALKQLK